MIEVLLRDYLDRVLDVPVYAERPADMPVSCVVIERTGGSIKNHIRDAVVAVQSYAPSLYDAIVLNEKVVDAMREAVAVPEISAVYLNSAYNYTDTDTDFYRYQAVFDVTFYVKEV